ncbi:MAG: condensation domain-containing protein, partial [Rhodospirillaceae bacterium]
EITRLDNADAAADHGPISGVQALGPAQTAFLARDLPVPDHHNQSVLLTLPAETDQSALAMAVGDLAVRHDQLRAAFTQEEAGLWIQTIAAPVASERFDLPALPMDRLAEEAEVLQAGLSLAEGRVFAAARFRDPAEDGQDRLLLIAHHLVVDGVSWRILLEDLAQALEARQGGQAPALAPRTTSYGAWAEYQSGVQAGLNPRTVPAARPLPGSDGGPGQEGETTAERVTLSVPTTTALMGAAHRAYGTRGDELLITALLRAVARQTGMQALDLVLEGHGRDGGSGDDPDAEVLAVDRTVGWFTDFRALALRAPADGALGPAVKAVKEALRAKPGSPRAAAPDQPAEIAFNYLGRLEETRLLPEPFGLAAEEGGASRASDNPRPYRLEIDGWIGSSGALEFRLAYAPGSLDPATVTALAAALSDCLSELASLAEAGTRLGYSPSDFPASGLEQGDLDRLFPPGSGGIEDVFPLSPMQDGMLYHGRLGEAGAEGMWFEQTTAVIKAPFDPEAFAAAWTGLHRRHGAFRSHYVWEGLPRPLQVVSEAANPDFALLDWRDDPDPEARLAAYLVADKAQGFDLGRAPLTRLRLIRFGPEEWRLTWSIHHSIFDGWCQSLVLRDLTALYLAHRPEALSGPDLPRPGRFADHVAWLASRDDSETEAFWRAEQAGFDPVVKISFEAFF